MPRAHSSIGSSAGVQAASELHADAHLHGRALTQRLLRWREVVDFSSYVWQSRMHKDFKIADLYPLPNDARQPAPG